MRSDFPRSRRCGLRARQCGLAGASRFLALGGRRSAREGTALGAMSPSDASHQKANAAIEKPEGTLGVAVSRSPRTRILHAVRSPFAPIWFATAGLFAISPALASGSLSSSSILAMLPFAAILAVASIGQTLVVQQRGFDLTIPGMMSLAAVLVTHYPHGQDSRLPVALVLVLVAALASGLVSALAITTFGITPIVATLGVNALLSGTVIAITNGVNSQAAHGLSSFALAKTAGIPNTVFVAVALILVASFAVGRTVAGRRFQAVGATPRSARVAGISVARHQAVAYIASALCAGAAGVLIAGFLVTPSTTVGTNYLLPSVAAVVLGGTALTGGRASVVASAMGALFLTQLDQLIQDMGAAISVQYIVQGVIIALGMSLRSVHLRPKSLSALLPRRGRAERPLDRAPAAGSVPRATNNHSRREGTR